jgi:hypothetical protein
MSHGDQSVYVAAKCPACDTQNQLTISLGSDELTVSCSGCGVQLGSVHQLATDTESSTLPTEPAVLPAHENVGTSQ